MPMPFSSAGIRLKGWVVGVRKFWRFQMGSTSRASKSVSHIAAVETVRDVLKSDTWDYHESSAVCHQEAWENIHLFV